MPAGQVIGRVSVKVLPDTDDFRRDAERKLSRIEKTLELSVSTRIDMSGASRQFLEELRKINQRNRVTDSRKIRFHTIISTDGMRETISNAVRQLNARAQDRKVKVPVDAIIGDVKVELDHEAMDQVKRDLEHWRKEQDPLKIGVKPELVAGTSSFVNARLAILTRPRTVEILPKLNQPAVAGVATALAALSGARVVSNWFEDIWNSLKNIDKAAPGIAAIALGVTTIAGWGLSAASNLAAMSASLAKIGPLALTLPGIFGGIAIGLGTTVAALKDFNKYLPEVSGILSQLQDTISTNFWSGFEAPMRNLIDSLLPEFTAGLGETATQLGQWFGGLAKAITGAFNPLLDGMFADLASSINIFEGATPALANIAAVLGSIGAGQLPELAQWMTTITERFSNFLSKAQETGKLDAWIITAKQNLSDLGRVFGNLGGILKGISDAATAAGGSTLGMMADTLERVNKAVNSDGFQNGLVNVLMAAHKAMTAIAVEAGPALGRFFDTLANTLMAVLPLVGDAVGTLLSAVADALAQPAIQHGITDLFSGINEAVNALAPALGPIGAALGALMSVIGTLLPVIANLVAAAFVPLANVVTELAPLLEPIITQLGGVLMQVVTALSPVIAALGQAFAEVMVELGPLLTELGKLVAYIMPVLVPVLKFLIGVLADSLIMAIHGVVLVISGAIKTISGIVEFFSDFFHGRWSELWEDVKTIASGVWDFIKGAFLILINVGILGVFKKGFTIFRSLWKGGWDAVKTLVVELWSSIKSRFSTFMDDLAALPGAALFAIKKLFAAVWGDIKAALGLAWDAIKSTVRRGIGDVKHTVAGLPGAAREALGDIGGALVEAGKALIRGFISGIGKMFGAVKGKLGELTGKLTSWKGPESLDRVLLVGAGQLIIDGLIKGLESRYDAVRKSLQGLTADISGTQVEPPSITQVKAAHGINNAVAGALTASLGEGGGQKVLNYYAAPGSSIDSEEDLFAAANRARMVGW